MCFFAAIGIRDEFVNTLSVLGDYWECTNSSILAINPKLKWNWLIDFNSQCACGLFSITKDKNNFHTMEIVVRKAHSCVIVNHIYSGNQNEEQLDLSPVTIITIDNFKKLTSLDLDVPMKIVL